MINADTGEILATALTTHRARDAAQVPVLLAQVDDELACTMADGAYDTSSVYAALEVHGPSPPPQILISPRRDAQTQGGANASSQRDATIRAIDAGGRMARRGSSNPLSQLLQSLRQHHTVTGDRGVRNDQHHLQ